MVEPLAVLLLPCRLEEFALRDYARDLLQIPRVVALEPPRRRPPRFLPDISSAVQARRLRFPGEPHVFILYHPGQYPLTRALCGRYEQAEVWYMRPDPAALRAERAHSLDQLLELDELACERAVASQILNAGADPGVINERLRLRLLDLEIISARPFVPYVRVDAR